MFLRRLLLLRGLWLLLLLLNLRGIRRECRDINRALAFSRWMRSILNIHHHHHQIIIITL
jgi:hypothetical protein